MLAVVLGAVIGLRAPAPAGAAVVHQQGFEATVLGFTSWYGSYGMAGLGQAWCIDHGSHAPDAAFGYVPTDVADQTAEGRVAMAWIVGHYGGAPDVVDAAALMLVLHDVMGAHYPTGDLDVDALTPAALGGFGGQEAAVIGRARAMKADGLARAGYQLPYRFTLTTEPVAPGGHGTVTATLADAAGHPIGGWPIELTAAGATLDAGPVTTAPDGRAVVGFAAAEGANQFRAAATVPDLVLHAYASSSTPAQRVAMPATLAVAATTEFTAKVPTGRVVVHKSGDASAYLDVAGAAFELRGPAATTRIVVGAGGEGRSRAVAPGDYQLVEVDPPPGYAPAGPVAVTVTDGQTTAVSVVDHARPGSATVTKVDDATGAAVAGAHLAVAYDADHDGSFETPVAEHVSAATPWHLGDLAPGAYQLTETGAPRGYERADPERFTVTGDHDVAVRMADHSRPPRRRRPRRRRPRRPPRRRQRQLDHRRPPPCPAPARPRQRCPRWGPGSSCSGPGWYAPAPATGGHLVAAGRFRLWLRAAPRGGRPHQIAASSCWCLAMARPASSRCAPSGAAPSRRRSTRRRPPPTVPGRRRRPRSTGPRPNRRRDMSSTRC
jgi:hypothetical protein